MDPKDAARKRLQEIINNLPDTNSNKSKYISMAAREDFARSVVDACGVIVLNSDCFSTLEHTLRGILGKNVGAQQDYVEPIIKVMASDYKTVVSDVLKDAFKMLEPTSVSHCLRKDRIKAFIDCVLDSVFSKDIKKAPHDFEMLIFKELYDSWNIQSVWRRAEAVAKGIKKHILDFS